MPFDYMMMYFITIGFVGIGCVLGIDIIDRKSDEMAGFRQRTARKNKR